MQILSFIQLKDLVAEAELEKVLDDHEIPYDSYGTFIESEKCIKNIRNEVDINE